MNNRQFLSHSAMLVGLLLLLASCTQVAQPTTSATPTVASAHPTASVPAAPTSSPSPLGKQSARLGPVPQDCPGAVLKQAVSNTGPVVGGSPVWAGGFIGPRAMLVWSPSEAVTYHNRYGWSHKLLWVVQNNVKGLVRIHGTNLRDGSLLRPDAEQEAPTSTSTLLVLDPQDPNLTNRVDQWAEFPGGLTIPEAGCYYLEAQWPGGSWRITFAAGMVPSNG